MYGWRARIGIIVSPPNTVAEVEFNQMVPEGVSVHASRMFRPPHASALTRESLQTTNESLPQVAGALAPLKPDVLVFTHTLGSMVWGAGNDGQLTNMLSESAGCPTITTAGAVLAAFQELGAKRVALVAPYPSQLVELEKEYLEQSLPGLKVVNHACLDMSNGWEIGNMEPREAFQAARGVDCADADVIFISGTNWRAIEAIEPLVQDLGKPVITANQVGMWAALRELGVSGVSGFGSLLQSH